MLLQLKEITNSLIKSLDILYVLESLKPVSRILFSEDKKKLLDFLKKNNISYELSDFKILKHTDSTRSYSDKGIKIKKDDKRKGELFLYISRDKSLAKKAKELEEKNAHFELGKLLGYPECCCRFFEKYSKEAEKATNDLTICTFKESSGFNFPWQNNNCLRCFDISLISHFPCRFDCEKTIQIAKNNLKIIGKYDRDISRYFANALKSAIIYAEGVGVYSIKQAKTHGNVVEYSPAGIIASSKNDFFFLLKSRNRITVLEKDDFLIGETRVTDAQTFLGLFS